MCLDYKDLRTIGFEWKIGGCESGFTLPDPTDPNIIWSSCYGDEVTRYDARTKGVRSVSPWMHTLDSPPNVLKYRCHWTPPLAIDPFDHNTVYYGCQVIFKTSDGGQSWKRINSDLRKGPLAYVNCVAEDPNHKGLLFAGTGNAFYYSLDDGGHWAHLQTGLPPSPVTWIAVQKHFHDVVVSTYGRGIYILDDITLLENMASHTPADVALYPPRSTYRFIPNGHAYLNFWLPSATPAQLAILDTHGNVIRHLEGPAGKAGLNRWVWDLRSINQPS